MTGSHLWMEAWAALRGERKLDWLGQTSQGWEAGDKAQGRLRLKEPVEQVVVQAAALVCISWGLRVDLKRRHVPSLLPPLLSLPLPLPRPCRQMLI